MPDDFLMKKIVKINSGPLSSVVPFNRLEIVNDRRNTGVTIHVKQHVIKKFSIGLKDYDVTFVNLVTFLKD
jgi:hypothetical protein